MQTLKKIHIICIAMAFLLASLGYAKPQYRHDEGHCDHSEQAAQVHCSNTDAQEACCFCDTEQDHGLCISCEQSCHCINGVEYIKLPTAYQTTPDPIQLKSTVIILSKSVTGRLALTEPAAQPGPNPYLKTPPKPLGNNLTQVTCVLLI